MMEYKRVTLKTEKEVNQVIEMKRNGWKIVSVDGFSEAVLLEKPKTN